MVVLVTFVGILVIFMEALLIIFIHNIPSLSTLFLQYAQYLMLDMVLEESMSPRTKSRMDQLVCCNTSGLPGGGLFRDKVIEIVVRKVKTTLREGFNKKNIKNNGINNILQ